MYIVLGSGTGGKFQQQLTKLWVFDLNACVALRDLASFGKSYNVL